MSRFEELLEKRKKLTANIFEEEELIELSKKMSEEELKNVDKLLLIPSNSNRLDNMIKILDKMNKILDKKNE